MKKIKSTKFRVVFTLLCALALLIVSKPMKSYANEYTFYITPSKVFDQNIAPGESKTYSIKVGSRILNEENESLKDVTFDVEVTAELQGEEGVTLPADGIFTISKNSFTLSPGKSETVDVTITAPEDILSGNYIGYVNFTKKEKSEGGENINATINNVLRIPMYVFMGTQEQYNSIVIDFDILDEYISFTGEKPNTIYDETIKSMKSLLNPLNGPKVYKDLSTRPYFNVMKNGKQILDINNNIYVPLKEVVSKNNKINDFKYFTYKSEDLKKNIKNAKLDNGAMVFTFDDDSTLSLLAYGDNANYIKSQLENMSKVNTDINLEYLLENLLVPLNVNYIQGKPLLITKIDNKSNIPLTLIGEMEVTRNNEPFYKTSILSSTIKAKSQDSIRNNISDSEMVEGKYSINGNLKMRDSEKKIESSFNVSNVRNKIMIYSGIFFFIYLLILIILLRLIFKFIFKSIRKKSAKTINNDNDNVEQNKKKLNDDV